MVIEERSIPMGRRQEAHMVQFEWQLVMPHEVDIGDVLMCTMHDDQWESRSCRVVDVDIDRRAGVLQVPDDKGDCHRWEYSYQVYLTCRHVNAKRPEALGGPTFLWHCYPWNKVARITPRESGIIEEEYELRGEVWVKL